MSHTPTLRDKAAEGLDAALRLRREQAVWVRIKDTAHYWKVGTERNAPRKLQQLDAGCLEANWLELQQGL